MDGGGTREGPIRIGEGREEGGGEKRARDVACIKLDRIALYVLRYN